MAAAMASTASHQLMKVFRRCRSSRRPRMAEGRRGWPWSSPCASMVERSSTSPPSLFGLWPYSCSETLMTDARRNYRKLLRVVPDRLADHLRQILAWRLDDGGHAASGYQHHQSSLVAFLVSVDKRHDLFGPILRRRRRSV